MSGYGEIDVVLPAFAASALSFVFIAFLYMKINAYPTGVNIDMDARGNPGPKGTLVDELSKQVRDGSIKIKRSPLEGVLTASKFISRSDLCYLFHAGCASHRWPLLSHRLHPSHNNPDRISCLQRHSSARRRR